MSRNSQDMHGGQAPLGSHGSIGGQNLQEQQHQQQPSSEHDILESFAESLSSMDYTTLCIMNHKSREDGERFQPPSMPMLQNPPNGFAPQFAQNPQGDAHNMIPAIFNPNSLSNIEKMHWQYLDGNLKNLYESQPAASAPPPPVDLKSLPVISSQSGSSSIPKGKTRAPSAAAKERRRERNKVLARKTRVKKKVEMETLRDQVLELMKENDRLKKVVAESLPDNSFVKSLLGDVQLPDAVVGLIQQTIEANQRSEINLLTLEQNSFCVVSAVEKDYPIIYASPGFYKLTGYSKEQTLGRNCRFLQGEETDKIQVSKMSAAIANKEDFKTVLLNYTKDGTKFYNRISVTHMQGLQGKAPFIIGIQSKLPVDPESTSIEGLQQTAQVGNGDSSTSLSSVTMKKVPSNSQVLSDVTMVGGLTSATARSTSSRSSGSTSPSTIKTKQMKEDEEVEEDEEEEEAQAMVGVGELRPVKAAKKHHYDSASSSSRTTSSSSHQSTTSAAMSTSSSSINVDAVNLATVEAIVNGDSNLSCPKPQQQQQQQQQLEATLRQKKEGDPEGGGGGDAGSRSSGDGGSGDTTGDGSNSDDAAPSEEGAEDVKLLFNF